MLWYYNFLVRRPYLLILGLSVLSLACIIVSLTMNALPDFSDPAMGFEARGTSIGKRLTAWQNLLQETEPSGILVVDPAELYAREQQRDEFIFSTVSPRHKNRRRNRNRKRKNKQRKKHKKPKNKHINAPDFDNYLNDSKHFTKTTSIAAWNGDSGVFRDYEITNDTWSASSEQLALNRSFEYGRNTTYVDEDYHREKVQTKKRTWDLLKTASLPTAREQDSTRTPTDGYFCDSPSKEYSHFVIERIGVNASDSLFDLNGIRAICELQQQITAVNTYEQYCEKEEQSQNCCRPWSLASYLTLLANKTSCFDLTTDDVYMLQNLLINCFKYFHDLKMSNDCNDDYPCPAPAECTRHNAVFNILHFLTDYNFIKPNQSSNLHLKYAMIFVPVVHSVKMLPLFHEYEKVNLKNEVLQVVAMDLGLENELFNELLLTDVWLVSLGGLVVMACIWLYTTSIFVTIMTCVAVIFCLGLAYFIYTIIFEMSFFPYMNLLAVVVIIGIGADNAFLFVKIWQCVLAERFAKSSTITTQSLTTVETVEYTESLQNLMALTLHHAAPSMIVSSLTTAGAFYASYVSSITSIKCFGVFAGTAVITNAFLMITWLPASISIMERISSCNACSKLQVQKLLLMTNKSINRFCKLFETAIISIVMKFAVYWIIVFATIGFCSAFIVLYWPGLQLPENAQFQLFVSKHPFEVYNSKLKNEFWFERSLLLYKNFKMHLNFVWGIEPIDDGDYSNPYSHGNLYFDNNFNISTKAAQVWLSNFCMQLKQQSFYERTFGLLLPDCFIENFRRHMDRRCVESMDGSDRTPCCDISKFPYEPHILELCLPQSISSLYATHREMFMPGVAGPKFFASPQTSGSINEENNMNWANNSSESDSELQAHTRHTIPLVKALVISFESNVSYSASYAEVKQFVQTVETWFAEQLNSAPKEMQGGWFISELNFFDVQDTLAHGTIVALTVAMIASSIVLLLVTLNVLVSFYAIITVSFTIFTTMAVLILLGWRLNVLESVTVSSAIGLAVDFSLHYGIHYRLSPTCERLAATQFAMTRIIGPTAMAAITTGFAGVFMLASNVLPYIQIGIFLVVVMTVSWFYGTFFLMSLLKVAGPQYGFMQFKYPRIIKKRAKNNGIKYYDRKQSTVVASQQLLTPSNSGIADLVNSETHELESLTSTNLIKTISGTDSLRAPTSVSASVSPNPSRHYEHTTFHNLPDSRLNATNISSLASAAVSTATGVLNKN